MQALDKTLRSQLESVVKEARDVAEEGARVALNRIGVGDKKKPDFLNEQQADLRVRLRARGRQLGDVLHNGGSQDIEHLVREVAYEHWHRMLFARFLAANNLLMHPELDVPVTLSDCEELAKEEGARDGFVLAARYATDMLPQIFRENDPVLEVEMAPEHRNKLQRMVEGLPQPVFEADDSLGWVYQFWQAKRKKEVNNSEEKVGADELPAVTQLFTEHYMVQFLLDNTLGAWWTARHPDTSLSFEYLRTLDDGTPAAGTFDGWPDAAAELTVMDPCMGSGHFLVAALPMLARMRMREERISARDAVDAVLRDNLHGLEIDERCTQIAAFALALAAWTFSGAEGYRELPEINLACSGLAPEGDLREWEKLAGDDERLRNGMRRLYTLFQDAPTLGSLIDPSAPENRLDTATFEELEPLLREALAEEQDHEATEREVVAYGIARAAEMLSGKYHLVTTNVPYLGRNKQDELLQEFCHGKYPDASSGLSAVFVQRGLDMCNRGGITALVTQQNWLFQTSYVELRNRLLKSYSFKTVVKLGEGAFESPQAAGAFAALSIVSRKRPQDANLVSGSDLSEIENPVRKAEYLRSGSFSALEQRSIAKNPSSIISLTSLEHLEPLSKYAYCYQGTSTGDNPRYTNNFWECPQKHWIWFQNPSHKTKLYSGRSTVVRWERLINTGSGSAIRGEDAWNSQGIALGQMRSLPATLYTGERFSNSTPVIIPNKAEWLPALWAFTTHGELYEAIRALNPKLSVDNGYVNKISWNPERWKEVAEKEYPDGLPEPYSDAPTQWIFHGHPAPSTRPLQVAVARLLGYRWPAERDEGMELSDEARQWIESAQKLNQFADEDGIVCLPAVQGERPAVDRLRDLLAAAYGDEWSAAKEEELLAEYGYKNQGLAAWLDGTGTPWSGKFADQHNSLFQNRPFIWHITDGHRDGFGALVNYHKLDRPTLERLTYTYLGDWIKRQEAALTRDEDGAEGRLLAAQKLQDELKKIIEGEPPYDIFVRWKPAYEQPIGWEPDLNDGVLINIYPFIEAGILNKEPNVRYTKDRGKNPDGAPWGPLRYNRYEDVPDEHKLKDENGNVIEHLTNAVKRWTREKIAS